MLNRSRLRLLGVLGWLCLYGVRNSALSPGWFGHVGLFAVAFVEAGVLWHFEVIAAAWREGWREEREAKRSR